MRNGCCRAALLWIVTSVFTAQGTVWDFEQDESAWRPRTETIELRRIPWTGATATSRACLQVMGTAHEGYNYALSNRIPVQAGQWYRLEGWVRVDKIDATTPMPYFKCELISRDTGARVGMAVTNKYNTVRIGLWQKLSCLFEAPIGTTEGVVALEKGTMDPAEIRAFVDDVTVEAVPEAQLYQQYGLPEHAAASLQSVRGVHPRLFLNPQRVGELQRGILTTHAGLWSEIKAIADGLAALNPPAYVASSGDAGQLWQRPVGSAMPYLALAYRLTGQTCYLDAAKRWALASCEYPTWGIDVRDSADLAAGHQLFGLALVYDWCFHDLDRTTRDRIRDTLVARGAAMFESTAKGRTWWHRLYLHNHMWISLSGLGAAGLAVFDETDDAQLWVGMAVQKLGTTMTVLGPDGASHEGVGYWEYGAEHLLKFMSLARDLLGVDFYDTDWWKNTSRYSLYLSLPRQSWARRNCVVDLADSPRYHWYGPDHILRHLAATYRDGYAQWLADQIDQANVESSNAQWLNLIWYDPAVPSRSPLSLPALHHFSDMGIVSTRTGWTGNDNLVVFKCGPFIGHKAIMEFCHDPGGGHSHPDAGHFVLFGNNEWLIRDDGIGDKWTSRHNTLLIGGIGQFGEGGGGFLAQAALDARARPQIVAATSTPEYDHIIGDATQAYPRTLGLTRFVRHLLFVKPDVLLVLDDVLCETTQDMELRFHPASTICEFAGSMAFAAGERTMLRLELLTPEAVTTQMDRSPADSVDGPNGPIVIRYTQTGRQWRNAVALSWADLQEKPQPVTLQAGASTWQFRVGDKTLRFDWQTGGIASEP